MEELERKSEEFLLSIRTIYSFRCVCTVKEGCPRESGSNGSSAVCASPFLASSWHDFGPVSEVGWLVCFQCRVNEIVFSLCCSPPGKSICAVHGLNALGCQCKSKEGV